MLNQYHADTLEPAVPSRGCNPTGARRRDPDFYGALDRAATATDLPEGADRFTAVRLLRRRNLAVRAGWTRGLVDHLEYLLQGTAPVDWLPDAIRVNWRTVARTAADLDISEAQVRRNERRLMELGAIAWRDSSNYRRDGRRSRDGPILWAYGVDLAPVALLTAELQRQAALLDAEQAEHRVLRTRLSRARRHSRDSLLQAVQDGRIPGPAADLLRSRLLALAPGAPVVRLAGEELARLCEAAEALEAELAERLGTEPEHPDESADGSADDSTNMRAPANPGCVPESITRPNSLQDVVAAEPPVSPDLPPGPAARRMAEKEEGSRAAKGPPNWLILETLSPRIADFLPTDRTPDARDLCDAANLARSEMGISPHAWREACELLTRVGAALAIIVIASRLDADEIRSPGGYLRGLAQAARAGRLDLARSLWGAVDRAERRQTEPAVEATADDPPGEPGQPSVHPPGRRLADPTTMDAIRRASLDPEGLNRAWRDLVSRNHRWPTVAEVERRHAALRFPARAEDAEGKGTTQ